MASSGRVSGVGAIWVCEVYTHDTDDTIVVAAAYRGPRMRG